MVTEVMQDHTNVGELNAGGFGNALSANVIIDGPNGYHEEVIVGIEGFWRDRPDSCKSLRRLYY